MTDKQVMQQALGSFLDSQDFYELMQAYRHTQMDAAKEFEAVRLALFAAIAQPEHLGVVPQTTHVSIAFDAIETIAQPVQPAPAHLSFFPKGLEGVVVHWPDLPANVTQDAARYRWLRDHENGTCVVNGELLRGEKLDRAVDNLTKETK